MHILYHKYHLGRPLLCISSVQLLSHVWLFVTPWLQHARLPCPSPTPGIYSNSCPSSQWCYPTISSSVIPFSSCLQSFPALGFFPMSQPFTWGGQNIGVSATTSVSHSFHCFPIYLPWSDGTRCYVYFTTKKSGKKEIIRVPNMSWWNSDQKQRSLLY